MANKLLERMQRRLYAAITSGPGLNCRPHASRQRVDLARLAPLDGLTPGAMVAALLGPGEVKLAPRLAAPAEPKEGDPPLTEEGRAALAAWEEQEALLRKLRLIAEDARTFEHDTGAHVLHLGFPLLCLPPGKLAAATKSGSLKRILAPVAFVPVKLAVKAGGTRQVSLVAAGEGADRVLPNTALLAWIEQQTGTRFPELFADEEGKAPWREIHELSLRVTEALGLAAPAELGPDLAIVPTPRADEETAAGVIPAAVLGLYPLSNQSLLRDVEALGQEENITGPLASFLTVNVSLDAPHAAGPPHEIAAPKRFSEERLVLAADPCQARAVGLSRRATGLVIHGPPGTGKSQTIANVLGDHLARGERVLFVCDKRSALDVVHHRISHLGLGSLTAVVHDAQKDQRDLYMGIREQLEGLPEAKTNAAAASELATVDAELDRIHAELSAFDRALGDRPGGAPSFHELVGEWLEIPPAKDAAPELPGVGLAALERSERDLRELLERARKEDFPRNPWRGALGISLDAYLARPSAEWRAALAGLVASAEKVDATASPEIPAFASSDDLGAQGDARLALAERLERILAGGAAGAALARWAGRDAAALAQARAQQESLKQHVATLEHEPLDPELALIAQSRPTTLQEVFDAHLKIAAYLGIARSWYAFACFGRKTQARSIVERFGLTLTPGNAERVQRLLAGQRARQLLQAFHDQTLAPGTQPGPLPDDLLRRALAQHAAIFEALATADRDPSLAAIVRERLVAGDGVALAQGLRKSKPRAEAIVELEGRARQTGLFPEGWRRATGAALRQGRLGAETFPLLERSLETVQGMARIERTLAALPAPLAAAAARLAEAGASADEGLPALRRAVLAAEIASRLRSEPALTAQDGERVRAAQERMRALAARKRDLVRDAILNDWTARQRERLLASTGSRLNGAGAELKRRLMLRGERALRVRQMIASGAGIEGGDPLFLCRPVWMASPETVAQIFPRAPLFDVLIFDEASQCRLEEALPVLTRAKRVVIAGDPQQLPPTRFFESALAPASHAEAETDQELFLEQQGEIEDLLGAALNLEIEQAYLDVHYRSQSPELIEFSNRSFYGGRLQPIPAHPSRRGKAPALRLIPVAGVYEKGTNAIEAARIVELVGELLAREQPPSIGVACMNLAQRDAIADALDAAAAADPAFGARLAVARSREGAGSFEGLFVKNLESVQGDERDHMILGTTYGPDAQGKFHRRFGPLGTAGGGRRLNVLVTRARQEVHVVTSIPAEAYRALPPPEAGRAPHGGWLLFAYLKYAADLAASHGQPPAALPVNGAGSRFARGLAAALAKTAALPSSVPWGSEGFAVDVALRDPARPEDVTLGLLCDGSRYERARDRVEWDAFRSEMLAQQGWRLRRVWTPQFFRDPAAALAAIAKEAGTPPAR
jgi:hypothetical protein